MAHMPRILSPPSGEGSSLESLEVGWAANSPGTAAQPADNTAGLASGRLRQQTLQACGGNCQHVIWYCLVASFTTSISMLSLCNVSSSISRHATQFQVWPPSSGCVRQAVLDYFPSINLMQQHAACMSHKSQHHGTGQLKTAPPCSPQPSAISSSPCQSEHPTLLQKCHTATVCHVHDCNDTIEK